MFDRLPMLDRYISTLKLSWKKHKSTLTEILREQVAPHFETLCSDVRLVAYAHHRWENPLVRSSEGDREEHIRFVVQAMVVAERYRADHLAMTADFWQTVEKLEDRRSVFEMNCVAQRVTMRSEEVRQYIEQGGYITWEWLERFGCRELSREEKQAEHFKAAVIVKDKRRLRNVLWAWRCTLQRPARFRTLSPAEEERLDILYQAILIKGKEFLCRELGDSGELVYLILRSEAMAHNFEPEDIFALVRRILENAGAKRMELVECEAKVKLSRRYNRRDHGDERITGWGWLEFSGEWLSDYETALADDNPVARLPRILLQHPEGFQWLCECMLLRCRNVEALEMKSRSQKRLLRQGRAMRTEQNLQQHAEVAEAARIARIEVALKEEGPTIRGVRLGKGAMLTHQHRATDAELAKMTRREFSNQMRLRHLVFLEMGGVPQGLMAEYNRRGMHDKSHVDAPRDQIVFFATDCNGRGQDIAYDYTLPMRAPRGSPKNTLGPMATLFRDCVLMAEATYGFGGVPAARQTRAADVFVARVNEPGARPRGRAAASTVDGDGTTPVARRALVCSSSDDDETDELLATNSAWRSAGGLPKVTRTPSTPRRSPLQSAVNLANASGSAMLVDQDL